MVATVISFHSKEGLHWIKCNHAPVTELTPVPLYPQYDGLY